MCLSGPKASSIFCVSRFTSEIDPYSAQGSRLPCRTLFGISFLDSAIPIFQSKPTTLQAMLLTSLRAKKAPFPKTVLGTCGNASQILEMYFRLNSEYCSGDSMPAQESKI